MLSAHQEDVAALKHSLGIIESAVAHGWQPSRPASSPVGRSPRVSRYKFSPRIAATNSSEEEDVTEDPSPQVPQLSVPPSQRWTAPVQKEQERHALDFDNKTEDMPGFLEELTQEGTTLAPLEADDETEAKTEAEAVLDGLVADARRS